MPVSPGFWWDIDPYHEIFIIVVEPADSWACEIIDIDLSLLFRTVLHCTVELYRRVAPFRSQDVV